MGAWYRSGGYLWAVWEDCGNYASVRKSFVSFWELYVPFAEPYVTVRLVYGPSGGDVRASVKNNVPIKQGYEPSRGDM